MPDHFSSVAAGYAKHRPAYPPELIAWLASLVTRRSLVWDCGAGSGQAARYLADEFDRVVATDLSPNQLAQATAHSRIEYRVAPESRSGLPDDSCDLVTSAQAAHWFDLPAFYREVDRVLRADGAIAVWGYAPFFVSPEIDRLLGWFEHERVGAFWPEGRELAIGQYRDLAFPYARIDAPAFEMVRQWTSADMLRYVETWSGVARCRATDDADPLPELSDMLAPLWGPRTRTVRWPLHVLAGRPTR